jgi:hypothetical protein
MSIFCNDTVAHGAWPRCRDEIGDERCVFDHPIRTGDDPSLYWDYPGSDPGGRVAYDDTTRLATVYPGPGPRGDVPPDARQRPYTDVENSRADQIAAYASVQVAQVAFSRAVGLTTAPEQLQALQEASMAAEGIAPGDPWRQPTGAHDAYPLGAVVTHNGQTWTSTVAANVWEPGVSSWTISGGGTPDWVQPSGATDAYPMGAVVTHNGKTWRSDIDANVWEPGVYGWTEITEG